MPALLLAALGCPAPAPRPQPAPNPETAPTQQGSAGCRTCHEEPYTAWVTSHHALAERALDPDADAGLLAARTWEHEPVRLLGVDPLVQVLLETTPGRLQVHQLAWDVNERELFDVFGDGRGPGEWGHWTGGGMTWNSRCASCHDTFVDRGLAPDGRYTTTQHEIGVGCEACHGEQPGHAAGGTATRLAPAQWEAVCASCHARRAELTGRFRPGDAFLDHFAPLLPGLDDSWWPTGRARAEVFEWGSFASSPMHAGGARCTSCHDPHSGALLAEGDTLCATCHAELEPHDHHQGAVACVDCHMPFTTYMQRHPRRDHGFLVPDPARAGEAPDACLDCHTEDRGTTEAAWKAWYGEGAERPRTGRMGQATALAVLGSSPEERTRLRGALSDPDALLRFAAAGSLVPAEATDVAALDKALVDPIRAVRIQAARALSPARPPSDPAMKDYRRYLDLNADDPSARAERGAWFAAHGSSAGLADLAAAVQMDPFSPGLRHQQGIVLAGAGRAEEARAALEEAVRLEPRDPEILHALGLARAGDADPDGAISAFEQAVAADPARPRTWYNLGLLQARQGRTEAGIASLRKAVGAAPDQLEIRYALAFTLKEAGQTEAARAEARQILAADPSHAGARALAR